MSAQPPACAERARAGEREQPAAPARASFARRIGTEHERDGRRVGDGVNEPRPAHLGVFRSASAQSDRPLAAVAPAASSPIRISRSDAD